MSRKGENIYKRKDGRWEARYIKTRTLDGKAVYGYVYAKTYREARQKLEQKKQEFEDIIPLINSPVFEQFANDWLKNAEVHLKPSTIAKYKNMLKNHIIPNLGHIPLCSIDIDCMENFTQQILLHGKKNKRGGLSPKSTKDILSLISQVFTYASKKGFIAPGHVKNLQVRVPEKTLKVMSYEEQRQLEEYLLKCDTQRSIGVMLSLYMGLRIGEICALRWENIDLDEEIIHVRFTMQRIQNFSQTEKKKTEILIAPPKSDSSVRDIPIPAFLIPILQKHRESDSAAFFLTGNAHHYLEPRTYQYFFKRTLNEIGIPETNYHVLRHTFATRCVENGFDAKSLSAILGHSTVNLTLNRYVHTSLEMKRKNMLKIREPLFYSSSEF